MYEQSSHTPFEDYHTAVNSTKWACETTSDSELYGFNYFLLPNHILFNGVNISMSLKLALLMGENGTKYV